MAKYRNGYDIFSLADLKAADEGGAGIQNAQDQEKNESFEEPKDEAISTCIVVSEIPKENASLEKPSEQEKTVTEDESEEVFSKKQPPKNVVTSWTTWVSETPHAPVDKKVDSSSRSQAKRYEAVA